MASRESRKFKSGYVGRCIFIWTEVIRYKDPTGILCASHHAIVESRSMHPNWPFHPHGREDKIQLGPVVRLEIGIRAMCTEFAAGKSIQLRISRLSPGISNFGTTQHVKNRGKHWVHMGEEYDSHLVLPYVWVPRWELKDVYAYIQIQRLPRWSSLPLIVPKTVTSMCPLTLKINRLVFITKQRCIDQLMGNYQRWRTVCRLSIY